MADPEYALYDWPGIQGRGEFVRLVLEEAGAHDVGVARLPRSNGGGIEAIFRVLGGRLGSHLPFAPPVLRAGKVRVAQTAAILQFLGPRLGLAPRDAGLRLWALQLQLTVTDLVAEAHDTHHPISVELTYEDQRTEARRRAHAFTSGRIPKFLGYFERVIEAAGGRYALGARLSHVDTSLFQVMEGLRYASPASSRSPSRSAPGPGSPPTSPRLAGFPSAPRASSATTPSSSTARRTADPPVAELGAPRTTSASSASMSAVLGMKASA